MSSKRRPSARCGARRARDESTRNRSGTPRQRANLSGIFCVGGYGRALRESNSSAIFPVWSARHSGCSALARFISRVPCFHRAATILGALTRPDRQRWRLCSWKRQMGHAHAASSEPKEHRRVTIKGQRFCIAELAELSGLSKRLLLERLAMGWPTERLLVPPRIYRSQP